jgi:hypothetical protein
MRLPDIGGRAALVVLMARIVSGVLFALGLLGMLKTGTDDLGSDSAEHMFVFTVHPLTAIVWLALGLVGMGMATDGIRARRYLIPVGLILLVWGILALAGAGSATQLFVDDGHVIALHLVGAAASLLVALAPVPGWAARPPAAEQESEGSEPGG